MCNNGRSGVTTKNSDGSGADSLNCCSPSTVQGNNPTYETYASCNDANTFGNTQANAKWCPISDNYDVDGTWGYCQDTVQPSGAYTFSTYYLLTLFPVVCV